MNNLSVRLAGIACLALVAVLIIAAPPATVSANPSGVLDACVNPGNGMMRLVDSGAECHPNEGLVEWNITGPQGPQGPEGSSAGGPPFVWVCTPASFPNAGGGPRADLYVFNGSSSAANVA